MCFILSVPQKTIDPTLADELRKETTYRPQSLPRYITTDRLLTQYAPRDGEGQFDRGYHYDPIDYAALGTALYPAVTLTIAPGVVVGAGAGQLGSFGFGLLLDSKLQAQGSPLDRVRLTHLSNVHEAPYTVTYDYSPMLFQVQASTAFLRFAVLAARRASADYFQTGRGDYCLRDCRIQGGEISGVSNYKLAATNCVFENVKIELTSEGTPLYCWLYNNTFQNGAITLFDNDYNGTFEVHDNIFQESSLVWDGVAHSYNGYIYAGSMPTWVNTQNGDVPLASLTFQNGPLSPTGVPDPALRLAVIDLNADGNLDIAAITFTNVTVLLGDGTGAFGPPESYPADRYSNFIAVGAGDFNRDGAPDLAMGASGLSSGALVLFNDGAGRFNNRTNIEFSNSLRSSTVGDFNGDGNDDVIAPDGDAVNLVAGDGDGTFQPTTVLPVSDADLAVVADFNEDGRPDLAILGRGRLTVWGQTAGEAFALLGESAILFSSHYRKAEVCDLNGDGHLDLAWASGGVAVNIAFGDGQGGFTTSYYTAGSRITSLAVGDLNADDWPDIAADTGAFGMYLSLLFNKGNGAFGAPNHDPGFDSWLADLDGDGAPELIGIDHSTLVIRSGTATGAFGQPETLAVEYQPRQIASADLNSDGNNDLVIGFYDPTITCSDDCPPWTNHLAVLLGQGDRTFSRAPDIVLSDQGSGISFGDFNHDDRVDLVATALGSDTRVLLGNADGTFAGVFHINDGSYAHASGDFNHDGHLDLVLGLDVYLGRGDGTFFQVWTNSLEFQYDVKTADFNGDGNLDLVASGGHGPVQVYLGNGDGTFALWWTAFFGAGTDGVGVGDFNQDGQEDLAVSGDYRLYVFAGRGDGTFETPAGEVFGQGRPAIIDLNGDAQLDIVIGGTVLLNQTLTRLQTERSNNSLELSWPAFTAGLMLESTESLAAPDWQRVPAPISVVGDHYVVTNATTRPTQFFRLRRQ